MLMLNVRLLSHPAIHYPHVVAAAFFQLFSGYFQAQTVCFKTKNVTSNQDLC